MAVTYSQNGVIVKPAGFDVIGGKKYNTVRMPDGKIWLAENLDFKFCNVGGSSTPTTANAWYYNNDESTYGWNGYKCGLLYNWYAIKWIEDHKTELCPGWHVPTTTELDNLATAIGGASTAGTKLKALDDSVGTGFPSGWNGTDDYRFSAIPSGEYSGSFNFIESRASFWTITEMGSEFAYRRYLRANEASIDPHTDYKTYAFSLRLVRDAT